MRQVVSLLSLLLGSTGEMDVSILGAKTCCEELCVWCTSLEVPLGRFDIFILASGILRRLTYPPVGHKKFARKGKAGAHPGRGHGRFLFFYFFFLGRDNVGVGMWVLLSFSLVSYD